MGFKRILLPQEELSGVRLTSAMAGIGLHFNAFADRDVNIEDTIFFASVDGMTRRDLRTLSVLVKWLDIYYRWINAGRLIKIIESSTEERVRAFWAAIAVWKKEDIRFKNFLSLYKGSRVEVMPPPFDSSFHYRRHGEDPRFEGGPLRAPANLLRDREIDVVPPGKTAVNNLYIRYRIMMGPTYRSDIWAALELDTGLSPTELARKTYGSFAVAWQVKRDWEILENARRKRKKNIA